MAILFMEGFDAFSAQSQIFEDSRISAFNSSTSLGIDTGRSGTGNAVSMNSTNDGLNLGLSATSSTTFWVQLGVKLDSLPISESIFFRMFSPDGTTHISLFINAAGSVVVKRSTSITLATSGTTIPVGSWFLLEWRVFLNSSTGTTLVNIDGVEAINATGLNTLGGTTAGVATMQIRGLSGGTQVIDDIVVGDDSGSDATDLLGEARIELLQPNGIGNSSGWTPLSGSNFQNVDDTNPIDGDTTYNSTSTATAKDTFTCTNLTASAGTVHAVQVGFAARKENGGARTMRNVIRSNVTEATGITRNAPETYGYRNDIFENDPDGGGNWTVSSVNAMEIGYELVT